MAGLSLELGKDRVRTFTHPEYGFTLTIKSPGMTERERIFRQYADDPKGLRTHIARNWFVAFSNIHPPGSEEDFENTATIRAQLLDDPLVSEFFAKKLATLTEWLDEGNAVSGAA